MHSLYAPSDSPQLPGQEYRTSDLLLHSSHALSSASFNPASPSPTAFPRPAGAKSPSLSSSDDEEGGGGGGGGSSSALLSSAQSALLPPPGSAPTAIPSPHFSSVLSSHIALLAEESTREQGETAFGRLYAQAKGKSNSRRIQSILQRRDIKKERKVELIAQLLVQLSQ